MSITEINFNDFKNANLKPEELRLSNDAVEFLNSTSSQAIKAWQVYPLQKKIFQSPKYVKFSHQLIKKPPFWFIVEPSANGIGSSGAVYRSELKIYIENNTAQIMPCDRVIKSMSTTSEEQEEVIAAVKNEVSKQRLHGVTVDGIVTEGNEIYIILENCGISLDKMLPLNPPSDYDFEFRLNLALSVCTEMMLLLQKNTIHRDLKPANICFKKLPNGKFQIIIIDFGIAEEYGAKGNSIISGTLAYMAPEVPKGGTSYESDIYPLSAILGDIFGATNTLKYKLKAKKDIDVLCAKFCFDGIFTGYPIPYDIDQTLLNNFLELLDLLQYSYYDRPKIEFITKFLTSIANRRVEYIKFQDTWAELEETFKEFADLYHSFGLDISSIEDIRQSSVSFQKSSDCFLTKMLQQQEEELVNLIKALPKFVSHLDITSSLHRKNLNVRDYDCFKPFPDLAPVISKISQFKASLFTFSNHVLSLKNNLTDGKKFQNTNSSGIIEMQKILNSTLSPDQKILKICEIGKNKIQPNFRNWFHNLHLGLFGKKGRHKNVNTLYRRVASFEKKCQSSMGLSGIRSVNEELDDINQYIAKNNFTH